MQGILYRTSFKICYKYNVAVNRSLRFSTWWKPCKFLTSLYITASNVIDDNCGKSQYKFTYGWKPFPSAMKVQLIGVLSGAANCSWVAMVASSPIGLNWTVSWALIPVDVSYAYKNESELTALSWNNNIEYLASIKNVIFISYKTKPFECHLRL